LSKKYLAKAARQIPNREHQDLWFAGHSQTSVQNVINFARDNSLLRLYLTADVIVGRHKYILQQSMG
jgi:hypothetical protein